MKPENQLPATTSKQMAFDMFDQMFAFGMSITEATQDIGFQRNNAIVEVANLGAAAHRALDAFIFVVVNEPNIQARYDIDLSYFRWLMRYDSGNYKHFRAMLRELQQAAIQVADDPLDINDALADNWISVPLLGPAAINRGRLVFDMAPALQRHLKDPDQAHWLSLRASSVFTLLYARVIYNRVLPFVEAGETPWYPVATVIGWPGGEASEKKTLFKYFQRDSLKPALAQINNNKRADFSIRCETRGATPRSKKIEFLRFHLTRKADALATNPALVLKDAAGQYQALKDEFGLTPANFDEIQENRERWTDAWIEHAMEYTRAMLAKGKLNKSVSGFLMYALRNNLRVASAEKVLQEQQEKLEQGRATKAQAVAQLEEKKVSAAAAQAAERERQDKEQMLAGIHAFDALPPDERAACVKAFAKSPSAKAATARDKIPLATLTEEQLRAHNLLARAFGHYMFQQVKKPRTIAG